MQAFPENRIHYDQTLTFKNESPGPILRGGCDSDSTIWRSVSE